MHFNPRSPWGERLSPTNVGCKIFAFQSTLPVGGATPHRAIFTVPLSISIHAPRGGSDSQKTGENRTFQTFQSTLPVGGATPRGVTAITNRIYFNPRSPWGERRIQIVIPNGGVDFNPRSPWGERPKGRTRSPGEEIFQSTLPVGGATMAIAAAGKLADISIHAPRGGSDCDLAEIVIPGIRFQSTLPVGGATASGCGYRMIRRLFQSTLPVGGATRLRHIRAVGFIISIHAPRGGSDCWPAWIRPGWSDFNPRSPWGERPRLRFLERRIPWISIHAPRGGSDSKDAQLLLGIFGER